jgi:Protein of unknown function (DUF2917)
MQHIYSIGSSPRAPSCGCSALQHSGAFALRTGRALSLKPAAPSLLRITQGSAWVTLPSQPGDHFLQAGDTLQVRPRDALVMEPWHMLQGQTLYFDWDPVPMHVPMHGPMLVPSAAHVSAREGWLRAAVPAHTRPSYCAAVLAPLADLRLAAGLGAGAIARLTTGLLGLAIGKLSDVAGFLAAAVTAASRARTNTA